MATKLEVKSKIVPRISAKIKLTPKEFLAALTAATIEQRTKIINAENNNSPLALGKAILELTGAKRKELAEAKADAILANDTISLTEFGNLL